MRKAISVLLFSIQLFGNEIVKCSGEGRTESEAIVNAQRKALQSFNTKLKVHFQKDISVVDREAKEKITYKLETSSNGVVSLLLPEVLRFLNRFAHFEMTKWGKVMPNLFYFPVISNPLG
jgi:hypothetical protein